MFCYVIISIAILRTKDARKGRFSFVSGKLVDDQGYVKTWRKTLDNEFLMTDNTAYLLFSKLLLLANRRNGFYVTGRYALAERVNLNPSTAYKALQRLQTHGMVTLKSDSHKTTIYICNWKKYQGVGDSTSSSTVAAREQHGNSTVTLNKKENDNENNVDFKKSREAAAKIRQQLKERGILK